MTYDLFLIGDLDPARLAAAFASLTGVPAGAVDVAEEDSDERDWDALVSCTYTQVDGDVNWQLDVYLNNVPTVVPSEADAAARLAEYLDQVVLYPAPIELPSAYWLVAPGGLVTRARLYRDDDDKFQLAAVERAVPQLPSIPVARQPEVIREYRVPAPITASLGDLAEPRVVALLGAWENLSSRMASGWLPDGWYPAEYYGEDLGVRDQLERLPAEVAGRVRAVLERLDENFRVLTIEDTDATLGGLLGISRIDLRLRDWWWHRIPDPVPWPADQDG
ncbi:MAG TPA: hypothetical protein VJ914_26515 [Pseudonocardiaceae bacterium]|nr:hypothetical protein [Pseudonocardiaceae bacterium]